MLAREQKSRKMAAFIVLGRRFGGVAMLENIYLLFYKILKNGFRSILVR